MPKQVEDCVNAVLRDNPDYSESKAWAICQAQQDKQDDVASETVGKATREVNSVLERGNLSKDEAWSVVITSKIADESDADAVKSVAYRNLTGEWGDIHPAEKSKEGREHLLSSYLSKVENLISEYREVVKDIRDDDSVTEQPFDEPVDEEADTQTLLDDEESENVTVDKSAGRHTVKFKMQSSRAIVPLFKSENGDMIVWGPASVEIVDKEGDRIAAKALTEALPQLLRRQRLSLEHTDQLVGEILELFETDEPITVEIDGKTFERSDFPTGVLELDGMEPALYVCGKVWDDTRQSRQAQQDIDNGDLDSYSISGESLVTTSKYENGELINDINELDLSAVTLCEEGMNQKAKFGIVQKADGDARNNYDSTHANASKASGRGSEDIHTSRYIRVVKHMTDEETKSDNASNRQSGTPSEVVSMDEIREEFKSIVDGALPDNELATKEDVMSKEDLEALIEEKSLSKEDVAGIAKETAEKVVHAALSEKGEDEMDEEFVEDDESVEDEPDEEFVEDGLDEEEKGHDEYEEEMDEESIESEPEEEVKDEDDIDYDGVPNDEDPAPMDDDVPGEEEVFDEGLGDEEEKAGYSHEELAELLPEDLFEAVREYLDSEPEEDVMEMSDDGNEDSDAKSDGTSEDDLDEYVEKMLGDEIVLDSPTGPSADIVKAWEKEDEEAGDDGALSPAAQGFYE